ncbi:MAG: hypothetical protein HY064_01415 [Bacteroidetes bacterium]|nr:hypothetical protein [Bacteroidota bacterium]
MQIIFRRIFLSAAIIFFSCNLCAQFWKHTGNFGLRASYNYDGHWSSIGIAPIYFQRFKQASDTSADMTIASRIFGIGAEYRIGAPKMIQEYYADASFHFLIAGVRAKAAVFISGTNITYAFVPAIGLSICGYIFVSGEYVFPMQNIDPVGVKGSRLEVEFNYPFHKPNKKFWHPYPVRE